MTSQTTPTAPMVLPANAHPDNCSCGCGGTDRTLLQAGTTYRCATIGCTVDTLWHEGPAEELTVFCGKHRNAADTAVAILSTAAAVSAWLAALGVASQSDADWATGPSPPSPSPPTRTAASRARRPRPPG